MNHNRLDAVEQYHMLEQGDRILAGLSGGADSVAMLHFLRSLREGYRLELYACHVNHHIRGGEADRDEAFCAGLCRDLGIPFFAVQVDALAYARESGRTVEEGARELRYRAFSQKAKELSGNGMVKIATAHTLSDSVETVLLNLCRGTGAAGLCGIPPVRDRIIRPIIGWTRAETEEYCKEHGLSYVTDSTNGDLHYTRNRIRAQVVPLLKGINPAFEEAVGRMCGVLREEEDYWAAQVDQALGRLREDSLKWGECWDREAFLSLPRALGLRVLREILRRGGLPYDARRLELALEQIRAGYGAVELSAGRYLAAEKEAFFLRRREMPLEPFCYPLAVGEAQTLPGGRTFRSRAVDAADYEQTKNFAKIGCNNLKNILDYDKIYGIVFLRQKKDGDRFDPVGRAGSRPLKKLFNDGKIPLRQRQAAVVLEDQQGILWVEGFGCSKRAAPGPGTRRVLILEVCEDKV